jgi:hypothetical protein
MMDLGALGTMCLSITAVWAQAPIVKEMSRHAILGDHLTSSSY